MENVYTVTEVLKILNSDSSNEPLYPADNISPQTEGTDLKDNLIKPILAIGNRYGKYICSAIH